MANENLKEYLKKLVPDYSYIDYGEKRTFSGSKPFWFNYLNDTTTYQPSFYRSIIVIDNGTINEVTSPYICVLIDTYDDRKIYVYEKNESTNNPTLNISTSSNVVEVLF